MVDYFYSHNLQLSIDQELQLQSVRIPWFYRNVLPLVKANVNRHARPPRIIEKHRGIRRPFSTRTYVLSAYAGNSTKPRYINNISDYQIKTDVLFTLVLSWKHAKNCVAYVTIYIIQTLNSFRLLILSPCNKNIYSCMKLSLRMFISSTHAISSKGSPGSVVVYPTENTMTLKKRKPDSYRWHQYIFENFFFLTG